MEKNLYDQIKNAWNKKNLDYSDEKGDCNGCSECCTVFAPISSEELRILKRKFTKKMRNKWLKDALDGTINVKCPFVSPNGCSIYNLRPNICQVYHCKADLKAFPKYPTSPPKMIYDVFEEEEIREFFVKIMMIGAENIGK